MGLKVLLSCPGAPNPDVSSIEVWYELLKEVNPEDFREAVLTLCRESVELWKVNFIAVIILKAEELAKVRISEANKKTLNDQIEEWKKDAAPQEEQEKFLKDLMSKLKEVPKE